MEEIKICKECKHCMPIRYTRTNNKGVYFNIEEWEGSKCSAFAEIDPVVGTRKYELCSEVRKDESLCGPEGSEWEARE